MLFLLVLRFLYYYDLFLKLRQNRYNVHKNQKYLSYKIIFKKNLN